MKKRWFRRISSVILILVTVLGTGFNIEEWQADVQQQKVSTGQVSNKMVIPGGMPIGIYMKTDGVLIIGTDAIKGNDGKTYSPAKYVVKKGDYIVAINEEDVESKSELVKEVSDLKSQDVTLRVRRDGEYINMKLKAVQSKDGNYKLGIWVRDSIQGLGTVTYITEDNQFGALGHGIHDSDIQTLLEIEEGRVYNTEILRIQKGKKGTPGGMEGMIIYNRSNILGQINKNADNGIYGTIKNIDSLVDEKETVPVCVKSEVEKGDAVIRCCVDGEVKEYDIEILKINRFVLEANKGMVIKITDDDLIRQTGGIVQGMSGSPILQDGKIVGAVTHVLVNDPTSGYGIFIEDMIKQ